MIRHEHLASSPPCRRPRAGSHVSLRSSSVRRPRAASEADVITKNSSWFPRAARQIAQASGRPITFVLALLAVVAWAACGPIFGFSDTWQLVVNTSTTIITFLMVFLIQNTQNRDTAAMQIKIDELIRVVEGAHNGLLDLEELDDATIERMRRRYEKLAERARERVERGELDTDRPEIEGVD
jgi:low affinity Fe/Cu permease